mmetsp:Transcript_54733/g.127727  ORF Transcript_54733/g.127727 Transcript_54733/m.127727 type:complete len:619 (+) Transcript_54733:20-1876(+)
MDLAASLSELTSAVNLLAERSSVEGSRTDSRSRADALATTRPPAGLPRALKESKLQAALEVQLASFGAFVADEIDHRDALRGEFFAGTSFLNHKRAVPCEFCARLYFPASLKLHQERCAARTLREGRLPGSSCTTPPRLEDTPSTLQSSSVQRENTSNSHSARLVCDFGDSATSDDSSEDGDLFKNGGLGLSYDSDGDGSTATPPKRAAAFSTASITETMASSDGVEASCVPLPSKLMKTKTRQSAACQTIRPAVGKEEGAKGRKASQTSKAGSVRGRPYPESGHRAASRTKKTTGCNGSRGLSRTASKAKALRNASTQTEKPKAKAATCVRPQGPQAAARIPKRANRAASSRPQPRRTCQGPARARSATPRRPTKPVKLTGSFSLPTISAAQKSRDASQVPEGPHNARSKSLERVCHRRCVACMVAEIRSLSWPRATHECRCPPRRRSQSRRAARKPRRKGLEGKEVPSSEAAELQNLARLSSLPVAECFSGAWLQVSREAVSNSEFILDLAKPSMQEVGDLAGEGVASRSLPCVPLSWICVNDLASFTRVQGSQPRALLAPASEPELRQVPPVVEVKVMRKPRSRRGQAASQQKSTASLGGLIHCTCCTGRTVQVL